jgi:hypothetical protein
MKRPVISKLKNLPAKCLLAWFLLFCFITIAGYSSSANSLRQQNFRIELSYSDAGRNANKTISYRKHLPVNKTTFHFHKYGLIILQVHSKLSKVKFNSFSKKINSILTPIRFVQIKTIPQSSGEDSFSSYTS